VEETGVPGENHQPVTSHWQTIFQDDVNNIMLESTIICITLVTDTIYYHCNDERNNLHIIQYFTTGLFPKCIDILSSYTAIKLTDIFIQKYI